MAPGREKEAMTARATELLPGIRRLRAPNPGPLTLTGTNTYLVGTRSLAVIDPGPDIVVHEEAILAAAGPAPVSHILVTHWHADHLALATRLAERTGAPVLSAGASGGLSDGTTVEGDGWRIVARAAPGHTRDHMVFEADRAVFSGDHLFDGTSTLISPPDGHLGRYLETSRRLKAHAGKVFLPGHGPPLDDAARRLDWVIAHREARHRAVASALSRAPSTLAAVARRAYSDLPEAMLPAAERNTLAHLLTLIDEGRAEEVTGGSEAPAYRSA